MERLEPKARRIIEVNKSFKSPGGMAVRFIEAINGYKSEFGPRPQSIEADAETLATLATISFKG